MKNFSLINSKSWLTDKQKWACRQHAMFSLADITVYEFNYPKENFENRLVMVVTCKQACDNSNKFKQMHVNWGIKANEKENPKITSVRHYFHTNKHTGIQIVDEIELGRLSSAIGLIQVKTKGLQKIWCLVRSQEKKN